MERKSASSTPMNPMLVEQLTEILRGTDQSPVRERGNHPELCEDVGRICAALEGADAILQMGSPHDDVDAQQWQRSKVAWLLSIAKDQAEELSYKVGLR